MGYYTILYKCSKRARELVGLLINYSSPVSYIKGRWQLIPILSSWLSTISYPTCDYGIIVKYHTVLEKVANQNTFANTQAFRRMCITRKYKWQVGYSMVYHERALLNYVIPCHRKYSGPNNQCHLRAAHVRKVRCYTVQYTTIFPYRIKWNISLVICIF